MGVGISTSARFAPLPPGQQLAAPGKWPIVGEREPSAWTGPWTVEVDGLVERSLSLTLDELRRLGWVERAIDLHCVTRWSQPGMRFGGVPLAALLDRAGVRPEARYVSFVAHSTRGHSTSLALDDALRLGVLVALEQEGRPLATEHGGPVRVVAPGRYFYKSLKWLARVELLAEDRPGFWETTAGYHNRADPWREERFAAGALDRATAARLFASRDFRGQHLLSLHAARLDLAGLRAEGALLRNADFRGAQLQGARFDGANLSNARFGGADLREAVLRDADLEGTDFSGADLRGADLSGASLIAATFFSVGEAGRELSEIDVGGATTPLPAREGLAEGSAPASTRLPAREGPGERSGVAPTPLPPREGLGEGSGVAPTPLPPREGLGEGSGCLEALIDATTRIDPVQLAHLMPAQAEWAAARFGLTPP